MDCGSSSSTSSESSTSSLTSSGSSSGSEASSAEEQITTQKTQKTQQSTMNTRRRSSEIKNAEKQATPNAKRQTNTSNTTTTRVLRKNAASSDEESPPTKKLPNESTAAATTTTTTATATATTTTTTTSTATTTTSATETTTTSPAAATTSTPVTTTAAASKTTAAVTTATTTAATTTTATPTTATTTTTTTTTATTQNAKRKLSTSTPVTKSQTTAAQNSNESSTKATQAANSKPSKLRNQTQKPATEADNKEKSKEQKLTPKRNRRKPATTQKTTDTLVTRTKTRLANTKQMAAKRNNTQKAILATVKTSDESGSASASDSDDGLSSSTDSEGTASSNSYSSLAAKAKQKSKRETTNGTRSKKTDVNEEPQVQVPATRKLTRSLSTRLPPTAIGASTNSNNINNKQMKKEASGTDTSSDGSEENCGKTPTKNGPQNLGTKKKAQRDKLNNHDFGCFIQQGCMSPPCQQEKKCPIEGCDSSGHLSGLLERHFLPEACPIYHNMSASECKERANERKLLTEQQIKIEQDSSNGNSMQGNRPITDEHKAYLSKINEARAQFQPMESTLTDKVLMEKDCTDEDREPSLVGFVPDYDLQMFREAQAIASQSIENEVKDLPVGKGIKYITMGKYKMKVWYQSPYPEDAARLPQMYICEFCLRYQKSETSIKRHALKCVWRHPPGDEIYRKGKLQVWQVDGKRHKQYCQHLCLLAKFFLDHKTLYCDVEPFLFYIMTLADIDGCHTVGYFSKEKNSFYNVSCILTLPPYQRKGYGRLLIDFSYLLTRVEGKCGSPEKPLSDLGLISYRSYWKDVLLDYLCNRTDNTLSIKDVSQEMAIYANDIVSTLQALGMMKYWKGKHIVLKKQDVLDEYAERVKRRGSFPKIDETCLRWSPFVQTHTADSP